jgi:dynein heavy chain
LEHFWYALPQEDFENKWEAIGWPYRISKQVEATEQYLKEEEERFYKIQLNDEYTLQDKIETLTAQVVQMAKQKDFSKTHEIAVDMRRLWKSMERGARAGSAVESATKTVQHSGGAF